MVGFEDAFFVGVDVNGSIMKKEKGEDMFKKRSTRVIAGICCLAFALATTAVAVDLNGEWLGERPEWAPDVSLSTTFLTKYIWRGQNLGDEPVMQFDGSLSKWGLTFDIWGNYSTNHDKTMDGGRYQEITELDYTVDYTFNVGEMAEKFEMGSLGFADPLSVSMGYTYYTFPNVDSGNKYFSSHEMYLGVAYDTLLQPSFTWYWDIGHGKGSGGSGGSGSYFLFGLGHTFEFENDITADLGLTFAYNDQQWTDKSGWSDMNISGGVNIPVFKYFTITPTVSYSVILDRKTYNDAQSNEFYGGVTIGFAY
ncbi:MAG: hypothetical protein PHH49_01955 [Candidatus Omnitrophica bacterium]|nr:hypothetical protein [Candidatus Omnitrophota bacterium]